MVRSACSAHCSLREPPLYAVSSLVVAATASLLLLSPDTAGRFAPLTRRYGAPPTRQVTGAGAPAWRGATPGRVFDGLSSRLPRVSRSRRGPFRVARITAAAGLVSLAVTGCSRAD